MRLRRKPQDEPTKDPKGQPTTDTGRANRFTWNEDDVRVIKKGKGGDSKP